MPFNDDGAQFSSAWDIDQIFSQGSGTASLSAGSGWPGVFSGVATRTTVTVPHSKGRSVICQLRYRKQGNDYWFAVGTPIYSPASFTAQQAGIQAAWESFTAQVDLIFINSSNSAVTVEYRYELIEDDITNWSALSVY